MDLSRINYIIDSSIEDLKKKDYIENLIIRLGFNTELLHEQPEIVRQNGGGLRIWQYPNQFSDYLNFLNKYQISSYIELGCRWGGTFVTTTEYLKKFNTITKSIAVDLEEFPDVKEYCEKNSPVCNFMKINTHSEEFSNYIKGNNFDLIFIDGDHSYEGVKKDFELCKNSGKIFVFHDIASDACPGTVTFWKELKVTHKHEYDFFEFCDQYEDVLRNTGQKFLGIGIAVLKTPRVCFITAIYGNYEATCKKFVNQEGIKVDFICFTDNPNIFSNCWKIVTTPYHITHNNTYDKDYVNSMSNNKHTFNIAKYYKQYFYNIPILKYYDTIIWVDGTVEIIHPNAAKYIHDKVQEHNIVTWEHERRGGVLQKEVKESLFDRYTSTFWHGQSQPYQDIIKQYDHYILDGYTDEFFRENNKGRKNFGVWLTCFAGFNMNSKFTTKFLQEWYNETLIHTTQDQISFPYVCFKNKFLPYTLPDDNVYGDSPHSHTMFYIKHWHSC